MTTWLCPPGVTAVLVECWGPGGTKLGGPVFVSDSCGGAGGGAYSRKAAIPTIPGNTYTVQWTVGGQTIFGSSLCVADNGGPQTIFSVSHGGGQGGLASSSIGDTKFSGGNGDIFTPSFPGYEPGGGGGGGAGRSGVGGNAVGQSPGACAEGGTGGVGGNIPGQSGQDATGLGGGGGAAGNVISETPVPGNSKDGAIAIYNDTSGGGWAGVLAGTVPLITTFGAAPAPPTPPVTARRASFFM